MTKIQGNSPGRIQQGMDAGKTDGDKKKKGGGFGKVLSKVADGALIATSAVAPFVPGGQLVKAAADGLYALKNDTPPGLSAGAGGGGQPQEQLDKMWQMQRENQVFNMQYLALQTEIQSENRRFSTMSNLMKARHDTAKSAINNMHV